MIVTFEQVLKDIETLSRREPEGFTIAEMSDETGHGIHWCRGQVRKLIRAGKIRCNGRKRVTRIDGQDGFAPVYVVT